MGRSVGWLIGRSVSRLVGWSVGWLISRLAGQSVGWSVGQLVSLHVRVRNERSDDKALKRDATIWAILLFGVFLVFLLISYFFCRPV